MTFDDDGGPTGSGGGAGKNVRTKGRAQMVARAVSAGALICLLALALVETIGLSSPVLRAALILGIVACGTGAILIDARRKCASCGAAYGYHLRIVSADKCRACGVRFEK